LSAGPPASRWTGASSFSESRGRAGKSDRIDALAAARKVLGGEGLSTPRAGGSLAPALLEDVGVGPISAAKLLACDPGRLKRGGLRALQRDGADPGLIG